MNIVKPSQEPSKPFCQFCLVVVADNQLNNMISLCNLCSLNLV